MVSFGEGEGVMIGSGCVCGVGNIFFLDLMVVTTNLIIALRIDHFKASFVQAFRALAVSLWALHTWKDSV